MIDVFENHRALLFGVAYRMLGSVAEAEDLVQETWIRWQRQAVTAVEAPKAWLVATITRLGIDHLRSARRRREEYVGVWLPEPIVDTGVAAPDENAALADSLSMAFLMMLEELGPVERAVFLLREAFDFDYDEIATIVGKSAQGCRQIVSRAKKHLSQKETTTKPPREKAEQIVQRFMNAVSTGELSELLATLTDNAVLYSDGGGRVRSALRPIVTSDRIARFYIGLRKRAWIGGVVKFTKINGEIGVIVRRGDGHLAVSTFAIDGDRIRAIYSVNNPDKLRHVVDGGVRDASAN